MTYKQLPNIDNAWDNVEFSTLSPSTFSWVNKGCGYQVMLQKALSSFADPSLLLPFNKNAIIPKTFQFRLIQNTSLITVISTN